MKTLTIRLDDEMHRLFKIYSINNKKDMQDILREYIEKVLKEEKEESQKTK